MSGKFLPGLIILFLISSCSQVDDQEKYTIEIIKVEANFEQMVSEKGMKEAFLHFADNHAVLNRNNKIIKGKDAISLYFDDQNLKAVKLEWQPDHIEISSSGDLAYTYGNYTYSALDSTGKRFESKGIFHTIWKRQADGSWKYVYD